MIAKPNKCHLITSKIEEIIVNTENYQIKTSMSEKLLEVL